MEIDFRESSAPLGGEMPRLRCEMAVPSGLRQNRLLVRLVQESAELLVLLPAADLATASHQLISAWGVPLLTHLNDEDQASADIFWKGYRNFAGSVTLTSLARPGATIVDAGAFVGYTSMALAHAVGREGIVYAFEPEPRNATLLLANALLWREVAPHAAPIEVCSYGLSDRTGDAPLYLAEKVLSLHTFMSGARSTSPAVRVPVQPLDLAAEGDNGAFRRPIEIIKATVQGSELPLLRGAEKVITCDQPILYLTFEPQRAGPTETTALVTWLRDHKYSAFRIFHGDVDDCHRMLGELGRLWTAEEVLDQARRNWIGATGTLIAFHRR